MFFVMPDCPTGQLRHFGTNAWETPFAQVLDAESLAVVGGFKAYGDMPPWGAGPDPQKIYPEGGYDYLAREFPELDYLEKCEIMHETASESQGEL